MFSPDQREKPPKRRNPALSSMGHAQRRKAAETSAGSASIHVATEGDSVFEKSAEGAADEKGMAKRARKTLNDKPQS